MNADRKGSVRLYQDKADEWRWSRVAANGETIADSGEGYVTRHDALAIAANLFPAVPIVNGDEEPGE